MAKRNNPTTSAPPHKFLDYQHIDIYYVYSFGWDTEKVSWSNLRNQLTKKSTRRDQDNKWTTPRLHDRSICHGDEAILANYQPNLVSKRRVLERTRLIKKDATLVIPPDSSLPVQTKNYKQFPFALGYTLRIFDDGVSTCTFHACVRKESTDTSLSMFEKIHSLLRLVRNVDYESQDHIFKKLKPQPASQPTDSYIRVPKGHPEDDEDWALFPRNFDFCRLHDLFRLLLKSPLSWFPPNAQDILTDGSVIDMDDPHQDFQTPFVLTVAEVEERSFGSFNQNPSLATTHEVASIMCRITLDNRTIQKDYLHISEDYLAHSLPYNETNKTLVNHCLDQRLFFSFSKRGAIAITHSLKDIPACFVVPSFLNLLEIMRGRWHICCTLNMQLDDFIDRILPPNTDHDLQKKDATPSLTISLIDSLIRLRHSYTRFLRDPVPYLFDGGSITEITQRAMEELGIHELSKAIHHKMQVLDAIRRDLEDKERQRRRETFEKELRRIRGVLGEAPDA